MFSADELLERSQWDFFWVPNDATVVDRPELLYVHCPRQAGYLNLVTRTRGCERELSGFIEEVRIAHQGYTSRWMIPATIDGAPLRRQLAAAGYGLEHPHHVYVLDTRSARPRANGGFFSVDAVDSLPRLLEWYRVADAAFGEPRARTDDELAFDLALCRGGGPTDRALVARVYRVVARDREDAAIACAAMTLFPTLRFALFWGAATLAHARGQGAYTQLVNARLSRARALGIEVVGLYARNETSAPIVARQGFVKHGPMDMWWRPGVHESGQ